MNCIFVNIGNFTIIKIIKLKTYYELLNATKYAHTYIIRIFCCIFDNAITILKNLWIFIPGGDDFYEPFIDADI